jgi:hypothetical protein
MSRKLLTKNTTATRRSVRTRALREGEFDPEEMEPVATPAPAIYSKYELFYMRLKTKPEKWFKVGYSTSKRSADSTASRLRRQWKNTITMVQDSEHKDGGYDVIAVYYSTRKELDEAINLYNLHVRG